MEAVLLNNKEALRELYDRSNLNRRRCRYEKMMCILKKIFNPTYMVTDINAEDRIQYNLQNVTVPNIHWIQQRALHNFISYADMTSTISIVAIDCSAKGINILYYENKDLNEQIFRKGKIKSIISEI